MGALESSLETLRIMKANMLDNSNPKHAAKWAIGSIITTLVSHLLQICGEVIGDSIEATQNDIEADARSDLLKIQAEFNGFIERMLGNG